MGNNSTDTTKEAMSLYLGDKKRMHAYIYLMVGVVNMYITV